MTTAESTATSRSVFEGSQGLERLKALMCAAAHVMGDVAGTQEFLLGWLYGLQDAGAVDEKAAYAARLFISDRRYLRAPDPSELYAYPTPQTKRVEGMSLVDLERAILAGAPSGGSRLERTYLLAADTAHDLHFVAKHYLFLSRARSASWTA